MPDEIGERRQLWGTLFPDVQGCLVEILRVRLWSTAECAGGQSEKIAHTVNNDDRHFLSVAFLLVWRVVVLVCRGPGQPG